MPQAMSGVQPLAPIPSLRMEVLAEASPAKMHGGPVNAFHGNYGEVASPYPWEEFAGPHFAHEPADDAMLDEGMPETRTLRAGEIGQDPAGDRTPYYTHGGPITKGMPAADRDPEGTAQYLMQSYEAHGVRTGAADKGRQGAYVQEDAWTGFWNTVPGDDILPPVPGQVSNQANGFGANDHTSNAYAKRNAFGLHASHRMRRFATGPIPGNTMWMQPGGRVMHKSIAGPSRPPVGEGPFMGQDVGYAYGIDGAILQDNPTEYVAPPQPYVVPAAVSTDDVAPGIALW